MKTSIRLTIIGALAVAVITALVLKRDKPSPEPVAAVPAAPSSAPTVAAKLPRLLDLGADKCIPCKMMVPILAELKREYAGRFEVEFIDVWKNPDAGQRYGIQMIPTQIFYDAEGKERFRHVGFIGKEDILAKFRELGVDLPQK